ncbi:MAG: hypothetical protein V2L15_07955 [Desulfobacteraceae bacterium]|jgi:hypothetical protein|nr:hypothetical protein [Desulfobacteraceae bacterium]
MASPEAAHDIASLVEKGAKVAYPEMSGSGILGRFGQETGGNEAVRPCPGNT